MALKLNIMGRRRPGTTLAEHRHHIRQVHGERVLEYIRVDAENAPRRYVQNTVVDGRFRAGPAGVDAFALNRDFVTQIWVPDFDALQRSRQTAFYNTHLKDDEDRFVDQANVVFMPSRERVIRAAVHPLGAAWKLFVVVQRAPGVKAETFATAWAAAAAEPVDMGALQHVQNDVLPVPGVASLADGIDEFWFLDEAAAHVALAAWETHLQARLGLSGLLASGACAALIATEDVVYPGSALK